MALHGCAQKWGEKRVQHLILPYTTGVSTNRANSWPNFDVYSLHLSNNDIIWSYAQVFQSDPKSELLSYM